MKLITAVSFLGLVAPAFPFPLIGSHEVWLKLTHIDGDAAIGKACAATIDRAITIAFSTTHMDSDYSIAFAETNTDTIIDETKKSTLRTSDWKWTNARIGGSVAFGCDLCDNEDPNQLGAIFLQKGSPLDAYALHRQFEIETLTELQASGCVAFHSLEDVEITFVTTNKVGDILRDDGDNMTVEEEMMGIDISNINYDSMTAECVLFANEQIGVVYNKMLPGGDSGFRLLESVTKSLTMADTFVGVKASNGGISAKAIGRYYYMTAWMILTAFWGCRLCPKDEDPISLSSGVHLVSTPPFGSLESKSVVTHRDFELAFLDKLKTSSCIAFKEITNVKVHFGESYAVAALAKKKKKNPHVGKKQIPISAEISPLSLNNMTAKCHELFNKVIIGEYNSIHPGDHDATLFDVIFDTDTLFPDEDSDPVLLENPILSRSVLPYSALPKWTKPYWYWGGSAWWGNLPLIESEKTTPLRNSQTQQVILDDMMHKKFEINLLATLKTTSCFADVTDIQIHFGSDVTNPLEAHLTVDK